MGDKKIASTANAAAATTAILKHFVIKLIMMREIYEFN